MGLTLTVAAGAVNMVLDYLFMGPLGMGVTGAALATGIGQCIPAVTGIVYFLIKKDGFAVCQTKAGLEGASGELPEWLLRDGDESVCGDRDVPVQYHYASSGKRRRSGGDHRRIIRAVFVLCPVSWLQHRGCAGVQLQLRRRKTGYAAKDLSDLYAVYYSFFCYHRGGSLCRCPADCPDICG